MNKKSEAKAASGESGQNITHISPQLDVLANLHHQIDALFEDWTKAWPSNRWSRLTHLHPFRSSAEKHLFQFPPLPACEVIDKADEVQVRAEIPGIELSDVEITLGPGVLTIQGEKKEEKQEESDGYVLAERSYGSFRRAIPVPDNIDRDKVDAEYKDGVMIVHLPKTAEGSEPTRKVTVRTA